MLKPVKDLIGLLDYSFQEGECTCVRCISEKDTNYTYPHNFTIGGSIYRRQFSSSSKSDLASKLTAALKSTFINEEFDINSPIDESIIKDILDDNYYERFLILGETNGLIKSQSEGKILCKLD